MLTAKACKHACMQADQPTFATPFHRNHTDVDESIHKSSTVKTVGRMLLKEVGQGQY
jgi:hypothetical protein